MELAPKKKNFVAFLKIYRVIFAYFCLVILREKEFLAGPNVKKRAPFTTVLSKFHQLNSLICVQQCYAGGAHTTQLS